MSVYCMLHHFQFATLSVATDKNIDIVPRNYYTKHRFRYFRIICMYCPFVLIYILADDRKKSTFAQTQHISPKNTNCVIDNAKITVFFLLKTHIRIYWNKWELSLFVNYVLHKPHNWETAKEIRNWQKRNVPANMSRCTQVHRLGKQLKPKSPWHRTKQNCRKFASATITNLCSGPSQKKNKSPLLCRVGS